MDEAAFDENYAQNKTLAELNPFRYRGYYYNTEIGLLLQSISFIFFEGVKRSAMVKKKLWAHYKRLRFILGFYIALFLTVPILSVLMSCLLHSSEIDGGIEGAVRSAILSGLKWYGIIMPIVTVLFALWFLYYSDVVQFTDACIQYYSWICAKKFREIPYDKITQVVFCDGIWWHKREYYRGRKIIFFNKNTIIFEPEISPELCLWVMLTLAKERIWLVNDNRNLRRVNDYFKIDFMSLSYDQQLAILKYYCKRIKYKTGEEILRKKKLI